MVQKGLYFLTTYLFYGTERVYIFLQSFFSMVQKGWVFPYNFSFPRYKKGGYFLTTFLFYGAESVGISLCLLNNNEFRTGIYRRSNSMHKNS